MTVSTTAFARLAETTDYQCPRRRNYPLTVTEQRNSGAAAGYRFQALYDKISRCICGEVVEKR